jgi:hypothetical protein
MVGPRQENEMRIASVFLAVAISAASFSAAGAQMTDPFEALARSKRQGIELEKRLKRDAAEQKKREQAQNITQRQQDLATANAQKAARGTAITKPSQPAAGQVAPSLTAPKP